MGKVTILWNQQVQTDRTIPNNKPDIIIRDNEGGTCMLIDVAISGDRNVINGVTEVGPSVVKRFKGHYPEQIFVKFQISMQKSRSIDICIHVCYRHED